MSKLSAVLVVWLFVQTMSSAAGFLESVGLGKRGTNTATPATSLLTASLSDDQMVQGLKQALDKGVREAVSRLGQDSGFLTNLNVRIPMPQQMRTVERTLRTLKQDQLADEFVATLNHAAEQAVPEAAGVFGQAVQQMSMADAKSILLGPTNAATQYFRKSAETNLFERFLPIVRQATDKAGVTSTYKRLMEKAGGGTSLGAFSRSLLGGDVDLDRYVTGKALDGLFIVVAEEEQRIRQNPLARTSDLLQKVFGAVATRPGGTK